MKEFWQRQWLAIDPRVFSWDAEGRVAVSVHQIVRDRTGTVLADQIVDHTHEMRDGLVRRNKITPTT